MKNANNRHQGSAGEIDCEALRRDLFNDGMAQAFGDMPAAIMDAFDAERVSNEELLRLAKARGVDINKYR